MKPFGNNESRSSLLLEALNNYKVSILAIDADGRLLSGENLPAIWPERADHIAQLPEAVRDPFDEALRHCRAFGAERMLSFDLVEDNQRLSFDAHMKPTDGGAVLFFRDVTEHRHEEAAIRDLTLEVSHRSKNLLAIVQSIATQTAAHSGDMPQFLDKLRARIFSLSIAQDLVTNNDWRGTRLRTLLLAQMARSGLDLDAKTTFDGADPLLTPNATLHVGLAVHELAANACGHGARSPGNNGTIAIAATLTDGDEPELALTWTEEVDGGLSSSEHAGFGTLVLERIVPLSVGGSAKYVRSANGISYRLTVPFGQFTA